MKTARFDLEISLHPLLKQGYRKQPVLVRFQGMQLVKKEETLNRLEPLTKIYYNRFKLCPACEQVYWRGSHYEQMLQLIEQVSKISL